MGASEREREREGGALLLCLAGDLLSLALLPVLQLRLSVREAAALGAVAAPGGFHQPKRAHPVGFHPNRKKTKGGCTCPMRSPRTAGRRVRSAPRSAAPPVAVVCDAARQRHTHTRAHTHSAPAVSARSDMTARAYQRHTQRVAPQGGRAEAVTACCPLKCTGVTPALGSGSEAPAQAHRRRLTKARGISPNRGLRPLRAVLVVRAPHQTPRRLLLVALRLPGTGVRTGGARMTTVAI
eukprot:COSAG01_NODE_11538_length_1910_cov_4.081171_2_plen_238_part_00